MYDAGAIPSPIFSICLAPNEGYFSLGGVNTTNHNANISYIPYYDSNFYKVKLKDIILNDQDITINDSEYYTIIDSGTTISYLPSKLFSQIERLVNVFCSQIDKCMGNMYTSTLGMCFKVKNSVNMKVFVESLPSLTFIFESGVKYEWKPENYLYNTTAENGNKPSFCIGVASWNSNEILLGTTWMHNHDIVFDVMNKRIGLVSSSCDSVSAVKFNPNSDLNDLVSNDSKDHESTCGSGTTNKNFYMMIIFMLSILIVLIVMIFVLAICRFRRGQNFLWMKLNNEESGKLFLNEFFS